MMLGPGGRERVCQHADYLDGVIVTLAWVCSEWAASSTVQVRLQERVHTEDVIEHGRDRRTAYPEPARWYGEGVEATITWLLGDSTVLHL